MLWPTDPNSLTKLLQGFYSRDSPRAGFPPGGRSILAGTNAVAFAPLALAALTKHRSGLRLIAPASVLLVAATITAHPFNQNWLHAVIFGDYLGYSNVGYLGIAFGFLCDVLINRARLATTLLNIAFNNVGSAFPALSADSEPFGQAELQELRSPLKSPQAAQTSKQPDHFGQYNYESCRYRGDARHRSVSRVWQPGRQGTGSVRSEGSSGVGERAVRTGIPSSDEYAGVASSFPACPVRRGEVLAKLGSSLRRRGLPCWPGDLLARLRHRARQSRARIRSQHRPCVYADSGNTLASVAREECGLAPSLNRSLAARHSAPVTPSPVMLCSGGGPLRVRRIQAFALPALSSGTLSAELFIQHS
jgi:hypothetical protein